MEMLLERPSRERQGSVEQSSSSRSSSLEEGDDVKDVRMPHTVHFSVSKIHTYTQYTTHLQYILVRRTLSHNHVIVKTTYMYDVMGEAACLVFLETTALEWFNLDT
ncbi:hypothetical protein RRG08_027489 [Elysia crispata]|uniref:Uncharacterized protein n=1 Tax=Elysia crispata TaxID=231223 RepID=A0AAE0YR26_9GAST|nr:hypothetical protein RRG08_027489 [Elysia crispata]